MRNRAEENDAQDVAGAPSGFVLSPLFNAKRASKRKQQHQLDHLGLQPRTKIMIE